MRGNKVAIDLNGQRRPCVSFDARKQNARLIRRFASNDPTQRNAEIIDNPVRGCRSERRCNDAELRILGISQSDTHFLAQKATTQPFAGNEFALEVALELAFRGDGTNFEPDESLLSIGNFGDDYGKAETIRLAARKPAPSAFLTGVC